MKAFVSLLMASALLGACSAPQHVADARSDLLAKYEHIQALTARTPTRCSQESATAAEFGACLGKAYENSANAMDWPGGMAEGSLAYPLGAIGEQYDRGMIGEYETVTKMDERIEAAFIAGADRTLTQAAQADAEVLASRQRWSNALAGGLAGAAAVAAATPEPPPLRQPFHCTTTGFGNMQSTTCP